MVDRERFRIAMAVSGLDQRELAHAIGVSTSTLSRALSGERRLSPETEQRLAATLGTALLHGSTLVAR